MQRRKQDKNNDKVSTFCSWSLLLIQQSSYLLLQRQPGQGWSLSSPSPETVVNLQINFRIFFLVGGLSVQSIDSRASYARTIFISSWLISNVDADSIDLPLSSSARPTWPVTLTCYPHQPPMAPLCWTSYQNVVCLNNIFCFCQHNIAGKRSPFISVSYSLK